MFLALIQLFLQAPVRRRLGSGARFIWSNYSLSGVGGGMSFSTGGGLGLELGGVGSPGKRFNFSG